MNQELEALILAFDAATEAPPDQAKHLAALFDARIDDALLRHSKYSREQLEDVVRLAHKRWLIAQKKPTSLPPKA